MSVSIKIDPINRDIELIKNDLLSPGAQAKYLAQIAQEAIDEAKEINRAATGSDPPYKVFVDGREGAPLESVSPNGTVLAEWELLGEVLQYIWDQLEKHSPVLTGSYVRSHVFYADGIEADISDPPSAAEYVFLNLTPYARKIEGIGRDEPLSEQAPDGVYEAVAHLAKGRFSNIAKISFNMREPTSGDVVDWATTGSKGNRRKTQISRDTRQPAIVVTVK